MDAVIPHTCREINSHCLTAYRVISVLLWMLKISQMSDEKLV